MKFTTVIAQGTSKNTTGIIVPDEVIEAMGAGKRPPVIVTLKGYSYTGTVASMGGTFMVSLSGEHRAGAAVSGGERVEVDIEHDTRPRTVDVPDDLAAALAAANARAAFDALAPSHRKEHVRSVLDAKADATRRRRIDAVITKLTQGNRS